MVAVVAAWNEEDTIATTAKSLTGIHAIGQVVVVADGSTDQTAEAAAGSGARVLSAPRRLGKGGAIESALDRIGEADVYVMVDGDVGETAAETRALLDEVLSGRLDLAIGRLPALEGGGFGLVKAFSRWAIRTISGFDPGAPLSGQRAITREALHACRPLARGFGLETAMTIDAVRLGFRAGEVPVDMRHRPTGRTLAGFSHRARQGVDILRAVVPRFLGLR